MPNYVLRKLKHIVVVAAISFLAILQSCEKTPVGELVSLEIRNVEVGAAAGSQFVAVEATGDWTLEIEGGSDWASLSRTSGSGSTATIVLTYEENPEYTSRGLTLVLKNSHSSLRAPFTQLEKTKGLGGKTLNPDRVTSWLELPATQEGDGRYFFTHSMQVGRYSGRNYSFYLDADAKISVWVAYPLNRSLIGSGSRTDEWALDPKVPREYQPVIYSGFKGGYERGHQLPSADRYGANESTFYGTNITPQRGELNEHAWAKLEGYVRDWSSQFDTLYVVTGADIKGSTTYATDNDGKKIVVPVGYFKALLGYKKGGTLGITPTTGGYTAIGFYFKHQSYSDSQIMAQSMTIDELEKKTGFDFFVNLPSKIGDTLADRVESTEDSWWQASK